MSEKLPVRLPAPAGNTKQYKLVVVSHLPDKCPICHHGCVPIFIDAISTPNVNRKILDRVQAVYKCPLNRCLQLFIADFYLTDESRGFEDVYEFLKLTPVTINYDEEIRLSNIEKISPRFYRVYKQAREAQDFQLDEIAGPGFRKSLEILVKDFLIDQKPAEKDSILAAQLAPCIKMIEHPTLQSMCDRATWLGNDETHYSRKWVDLDIEHLKALIQIVVQWIHTVIETKNWESKMPKPVKEKEKK